MGTADFGEFDHQAFEAAARQLWEEHRVHQFDPATTGPVYSVDTPPPYVSGSQLHVGHAMSYAQADFVVRFRRMRGDRVFYPIGFDDNGLPTERYVEQLHRVRAADVARAKFVELCLAETRQAADRYEQLWRRVGLSVDWSLRYSTIDSRCQRTAQTSFVRLYEAGHLRRAEDPIQWCPECRTAVAQADVEDLPRRGQLHRIAFPTSRGGEPVVIATSRPELLPACVALYAHPDDPRYRRLAGTTVTVPLSGHRVPVRHDPEVDPEFGTGLLMVATFGDGEDVRRWRRDRLPLRLRVTGDGRLAEQAGELAGLPLGQARTRTVARLSELGALVSSEQIKQVVGAHERCGTPIEFQVRPQWFMALLPHREQLRQRARELAWVPESMRRRLTDWIDGLKWDWNLSRQRHYGVPFPAWFCRDCARPVLARPASLPVDPLVDPPPVASCPDCGGGFDGDPDVMDTWFTSSLSPQINDGWASGGSDPRLSPMTLRVQGFEIIRTWLFYTLVQSQLHFDRLPWQQVMISGWGLNEQGRKIAKRDLTEPAAGGYNRYLIDQVIDRYGADALRLWATRARIGADLRYHERDVRAGRKLVVKLWNVARFVAEYGGETPPAALPPAARTSVDRWLLAHLAETVVEATGALERYDPMAAQLATARFFWSTYCDRYLEMVKGRFWYPGEHSDRERDSARVTLRESLRVLLGLFAPYAPFITEHLYQLLYRASEPAASQPSASLHLTGWPQVQPGWPDPAAARVEVDQLVTILDQVRVLRSQLRLGAGRRITTLELHADPDRQQLVAAIAGPLRTAAHAETVATLTGPGGHPSGVPGVGVAIRA